MIMWRWRRRKFAEPMERPNLFNAVLQLFLICKLHDNALHIPVPHFSNRHTAWTVPGHKSNGISWLYEIVTNLQDLFPLFLGAYWIFTNHLVGRSHNAH